MVLAEGPEGTSKARYLERMKDLELEKMACTRDLMEILERKILSHKDLSSHYKLDCLKAHDALFFSRKDLEDGGSNRYSEEIDFWPFQLSTP